MPSTSAPILDETLVLGRLVEDLRTVALSEAGTLPLHREPTDLGLLIQDGARSFATLAGAAGISIVADLGPDRGLPPLDIDPVRIREVLDNLIANALRYTPAGGTVTLTALRPSGRDVVQVSVSDTGAGIAPDVAEHLFDRFVKSDRLARIRARPGHRQAHRGGPRRADRGAQPAGRRQHDPVQPADWRA